MSTGWQIERRQDLSQDDLDGIRSLAAECSAADEVDVRIDWESLAQHPLSEITCLVCRRGGRIVGFLGLYSFTPAEAEVTGMVHPAHRTHGVFTSLIATARGECSARGIPRLLCVTEKSSVSGLHFVTAARARLSHSEFKMEYRPGGQDWRVSPSRGIGDGFRGSTRPRVRLERATQSDAGDLAVTDQACFNLPAEHIGHMTDSIEKMLQNPDTWLLFGILGERRIGKIRLSFENEASFICGFCILPEYRGRGLGADMLAQSLDLMQSRAQRPIQLEVDCGNSRALGLYRGFGFKEIATYDYYEIPI